MTVYDPTAGLDRIATWISKVLHINLFYDELKAGASNRWEKVPERHRPYALVPEVFFILTYHKMRVVYQEMTPVA